MIINNNSSIASRTLRLAVFRIALVSFCAGAVSYFVNHSSIEEAVRKQLSLSTEQTLQRESLPFKEIKDLQRNFLHDFRDVYTQPSLRHRLASDFDLIFYRHSDGSYTQRPGLFEGNSLPDGRQFALMSATYSPEISPNDDVKARFTLAYILSHKYGSSIKGRLFNFYGVVPEKGFPIYQTANIANTFTYTGADALKLETYEFYYRGFGSPANDTIFTRMYFDYSNNAWMTTVATPDIADASGKHKILACVDVLLDELMQRTAKPTIQGARSIIFQADADGTLLYHAKHTDTIKRSEGKASIRSLKLKNYYPLLEASRAATPGKVSLITTADEIVAVGIIPETPWALAVHYPKSLMQPAILQNLAIVIALAIVTLLVEIFIIRSILQNQVALPLSRLMQAMRQVGMSNKPLDSSILPTQAQDEIGELAREFAGMADRVHDAQEQLESKVLERTEELKEANRKLTAMSTTDTLTGIANRRRFDEVLTGEWKRALRSGDWLALAIVDVDWFKNYNDHYGHQAGDACLQQVAGTLTANLHRAGDLVARYGGEEFSIVMPAIDAESALRLAEELCRAMETAMLPHCESPFGHITISIGVAAVRPTKNQAPADLLREADQSLYKAKALGRNRAVSMATV